MLSTLIVIAGLWFISWSNNNIKDEQKREKERVIAERHYRKIHRGVHRNV